MAQTPLSRERRRARLTVPDLRERPFVGAGCCVLPASELVCDSLGQIPGVHSVTCDDVQGVVGLEFDAGSSAVPSAVSVLDGLGYRVAAVEA